MIIKKLFQSPQFPYHNVVETLDGQFMKFLISPARCIVEKDLSPVPYYQARGNNADEAPDYIYWMYGLEKPKEG